MTKANKLELKLRNAFGLKEEYNNVSCSHAVLGNYPGNYPGADDDDAWQSSCPWQGQNLPVGEERPSSVFWGRNTAGK